MKALLLIILIAGAILGKASIFILPEGRQAIVKQFGKIVGETISKPGIHFKKPFINEVVYVEKRILSWDGYPNQIPTKDKKFISVDTTARWRITDPKLFIETVRNEDEAKDKIDSIIDSKTRDLISENNLVEAVRNSNSVLESSESGVDEDVLSSVKIESIEVGREKLSTMITERANEALKGIGIEVIDVQFRRVSYEKSVEQKVYERMRSERMRIAEKIRSKGRAEKAKIEGRLSKTLQVINSSAYKQAEIIKGKGESDSVKIYANAYKKSPRFFEFLRTMEAYKKSLTEETSFILSSDSEYLKFIKKEK